MTPIDAAANTWVERLSPAARRAADDATDHALMVWFAGGALAVIAAWLIHRSGVLALLLRRIEAEKPRPWLASAAAAVVFAALLLAALAPFDILIARSSPADLLAGDLIKLLAALIALPLLYGLMRWTPRFWWAWGGAAAVVLSVALTWAPYAAASGPANLPAVPPGATRDALTDLFRAAHLPADQVYVSRDRRVWADVTGLPGKPRVVVSPPMLQKASAAEIRANVGHLISHYQHGDQLALALVLGALAAAALLAAQLLYPPLARLIAAPGAIADPVSLPVLAVIGVLALGFSGAAFATFDRLINVRADAESLDHAREPDGLAISLL
ncbi:MAG TPA: M48 family metalloprotease, partial [Caulobacteraceae bacterium]|nr:M48 family metalloprotease [Caulobacteraceae bacterium]